jgi:excisionase family DNA binding protein
MSQRLLKRLLTIKSANGEYGIPTSTLYRLIADGKLAEVRLPGAERRVWLDREDLERLIMSSRGVRS